METITKNNVLDSDKVYKDGFKDGYVKAMKEIIKLLKDGNRVASLSLVYEKLNQIAGIGNMVTKIDPVDSPMEN